MEVTDGFRVSPPSGMTVVDPRIAPLQFVNGASLVSDSGVDKLAAGIAKSGDNILEGIKIGVSGITEGMRDSRALTLHKEQMALQQRNHDEQMALGRDRLELGREKYENPASKDPTALQQAQLEKIQRGMNAQDPAMPWDSGTSLKSVAAPVGDAPADSPSDSLSGLLPMPTGNAQNAAAIIPSPTSKASGLIDLPATAGPDSLSSSLSSVPAPSMSNPDVAGALADSSSSALGSVPSPSSASAPATVTSPKVAAPEKGGWFDAGGGLHGFAFPGGKVLYAQKDASKKEGFSWIPGAGEDPEAKIAAQAAKDDAAGNRDQKLAETHNRSIRQEQNTFNNIPAVKNLEGQNGPRQALPRFYADYTAIKKNPAGSGISDVGLLDMYARAESGGRVTEQQAHMALGANSLADKAKLLLGEKPLNGAILSQTQRDQMLKVITENYNMGAQLANQSIETTRARLVDQGVTKESQLPQPYVLLETKDTVNEQLGELKAQAVELANSQAALLKSGKTSEANALAAKIAELQKQGLALAAKKNSTDSIYNMKDFLKKPQGFGSGGTAVTINQE